MTNLLLSILFISLVCNGIYVCMDEGMILYPLWKRIEKLTTKKSGDAVKYHFLFKPLGGCLTCMASIYGSIVYWLIFPFTVTHLILWVPVILAVSFVNLIVNKLI